MTRPRTHRSRAALRPDINPLLSISGAPSAVIPTPTFWLIAAMPTAAADERQGQTGVGRLQSSGDPRSGTALLGLGLAYLVDRAGRAESEAPPVEGTITRGIGGVELKIPAAFFRNDEQRSEGFADEIELLAHLPLGADGRDVAIEVTLLAAQPRAPERDPARRRLSPPVRGRAAHGSAGPCRKAAHGQRRLCRRDGLVRRAIGRPVRRKMPRADRAGRADPVPAHRRPRQRRGGLHVRGRRADELAAVRCGAGALARRDGHPLSARRSRRDRRRGSPSGNCRTGRRPRRRRR